MYVFIFFICFQLVFFQRNVSFIKVKYFVLIIVGLVFKVKNSGCYIVGVFKYLFNEFIVMSSIKLQFIYNFNVISKKKKNLKVIACIIKISFLLRWCKFLIINFLRLQIIRIIEGQYVFKKEQKVQEEDECMQN